MINNSIKICDIKNKFYGWTAITDKGNVFQYKAGEKNSNKIDHMDVYSLTMLESQYKITIIMPFSKTCVYKDKYITVPGLPSKRVGFSLTISNSQVINSEDVQEMKYNKTCKLILEEKKGAEVQLDFYQTNDKHQFNLNIKSKSNDEITSN